MPTDIKPPKELRGAASLLKSGQPTDKVFQSWSNARLRIWVKRTKGSPTGIQNQLHQELRRRKLAGG